MHSRLSDWRRSFCESRYHVERGISSSLLDRLRSRLAAEWPPLGLLHHREPGYSRLAESPRGLWWFGAPCSLSRGIWRFRCGAQTLAHVMLCVCQILPGMIVGLCQETPSDCAEGHGGCLESSCLCGLVCCSSVGFLNRPIYRASAIASLDTNFRAVSYRHLRSLILRSLPSLKKGKAIWKFELIGGSTQGFWIV